MKILKQIPVLFILVVFAYNIIGYDVAFRVTRYQITKEVKRKLKAGVPEAELVTIVIPKAWEENNNHIFQRIHKGEFRYKGELYDNVSSEDRGDFIVYKCISDEQETNLFVELEQHVQQHVAGTEKRNEGNNQHLLKKIVKDYYNNSSPSALTAFSNSNVLQLVPCSCALPASFNAPLLSPPKVS